MAEKFNVVICVTSSAKLATIMQVLDGEAKLISVEQVEEDKKRTKRNYPTNVVRHAAGTRAIDITLDLAKGGGDLTLEKVESVLTAKGFSKNTAGPRLSELVKSGKLEQVRRGVFKINPKSK